MNLRVIINISQILPLLRSKSRSGVGIGPRRRLDPDDESVFPESILGLNLENADASIQNSPQWPLVRAIQLFPQVPPVLARTRKARERYQ